ncbi:DUF6745 domain-containing protein [Actinomadura sp. 9N407]|uniref:DUF6745 domain-containing protein n=1 Tax=Actinomadura sp. 9N407 TaxID=3375154 RepID=UPI0037AB8C5E
MTLQREAADIREEWLGRALSTLPADRPAAEAAISGIYGLLGLDPPRFHWVPSPVAAMETVPPAVRLRPSESVDRMTEWPLPRRFGALMREFDRELDQQVRWVQKGMDRQLRLMVRSSLSTSCDSTLAMALRTAHDTPRQMPHSWYAAQCVSWVAHNDALRRVAGVVFTPEQTRRLDLWAEVARSCRWWWPREDFCVVSERPVSVHTEVWGSDGQVRLHSADGPAMRFRDGADVHAWHGAMVPGWVLTDPAVWRIAREPNVEIRRCAIERIGWADYIDQAGLRLIGSAPDPGNPGSELRLYDMRRETRVLLAVNGSVERDGHRRRYGLTVPGHLDDPVAAAGWTYGLSAAQYSQLARRT